MSPKIDSHIPLPKLRKQWKCLIRKMKVGDSFFEPRPPLEVRNGLNHYAMAVGMTLTVRKFTEKGVAGTRVWRVK